MLWACDGAVPTPDLGELVLKAAGERIVAFARPGKPPGNSFFRANQVPAVQPNAVILATRQRFLKLGELGIGPQGENEWPQ
jgi:hypothetical protein